MSFDVILKNNKGKLVAAYIDKPADAALMQATRWVEESKQIGNGFRVHFQIH